jgi:cob(I)alamin adenosyltransferase
MTALGNRQRVRKNALRVEAYGDVDELNSVLGVALASGLSPTLAEALSLIQNELFHLGADLAFPVNDERGVEVPRIEGRHVEKLEALIDDLTEAVGPAENFVMPGGSAGAAHLHVARATCRRAERKVVALDEIEVVGAELLRYLNRLSDALFAMARYENQEKGVVETLWDSRA